MKCFLIFLMQSTVAFAQTIFIIKNNFIASGIVQSTDKLGAFRNLNSTLAKQCSYFNIICHGRENSGIYRARSTATCATIVCRIMRVVDRARTMSNNINDIGKIFHKSSASQYTFNAIGHFSNGKTNL